MFTHKGILGQRDRHPREGRCKGAWLSQATEGGLEPPEGASSASTLISDLLAPALWVSLFPLARTGDCGGDCRTFVQPSPPGPLGPHPPTQPRLILGAVDRGTGTRAGGAVSECAHVTHSSLPPDFLALSPRKPGTVETTRPEPKQTLLSYPGLCRETKERV